MYSQIDIDHSNVVIFSSYYSREDIGEYLGHYNFIYVDKSLEEELVDGDMNLKQS